MSDIDWPLFLGFITGAPIGIYMANKFMHYIDNKTKRRKLKNGVHSDGLPYLDISDRDTAMAIKEAAEKFRDIEVN